MLCYALQVRHLYKRCVHPAAAPLRLFFVGFARPGFGATPSIA
jgi:hypothetical protein